MWLYVYEDEDMFDLRHCFICSEICSLGPGKLMCKGCRKWYHVKCLDGYPDVEYDDFSYGTPWTCHRCKSDRCPPGWMQPPKNSPAMKKRRFEEVSTVGGAGDEEDDQMEVDDMMQDDEDSPSSSTSGEFYPSHHVEKKRRI